MLYLDLSESHVSPDFIVVQALPPGTTVDKYRLHEAVSEDACGIVYRAEDLELNCQVAVKEYLPRHLASRVSDGGIKPRSEALAAEFEAGVQAFAEDALLLASLRIPSIVSVSHAWQEGGTAYRAMPWLEGETLAARLAAHQLPSGHLLQQKVLEPLLDALQALHTRRHVHRRITGETVFFTADSRLILFGFSMLSDRGDSRLAAHDAFTSIELIEARRHRVEASPIGPWSDIYSIGALMHLIVRGALPSMASSRLAKEDYGLLGSMPELGYSVDLLRAIDWALTIRPEKRPRDIAQFRKRFRAEKRKPVPAVRQVGASTQIPADGLRQADPAESPAPRTVPPSNLNAARSEALEFAATRPMVYGDTLVPPPAGISENVPPSQPAAAVNAATAPAAPTDPEPKPEPAATPQQATEAAATSPSASAATEAMTPPPASPAENPAQRSMGRGRWIAGATIAAGLALVALTGWWLLGPLVHPSVESAAAVAAVPGLEAAPAATVPSGIDSAASAASAPTPPTAAPRLDVAAAAVAAASAASSAADVVSTPPFDLPQLRADAAPPVRHTTTTAPAATVRVSLPGRPQTEEPSAPREDLPQREGTRSTRAAKPPADPPVEERGSAPTPARKAIDRRCSELLARLSLGDSVAARSSVNQKCQ